MAWGRGAGKGREGAEDVDVDYAPRSQSLGVTSTSLWQQLDCSLVRSDSLTPVPLLEMYTRGVTFHVSRADSRKLLPDVISLVASGRLGPLNIPTTVVPWDQAPEAWLEPATKLVLVR